MKTIITAILLSYLLVLASVSLVLAQDASTEKVTVTKTKELTCTWIPSAKLMVCTKN